MIDRNRGCMIRHHRSGMRVVMYYDEPGVYYDEKGGQVGETMAQQVGFDVKSDRIANRKQTIRRRFEAMLEDQFNLDGDMVDKAAEGGDIKLTANKNGRYHIYSESGERLSRTDMSEQEARMLYESVTGKPFKATKASGGKKGGEKASESKSESKSEKETSSEGGGSDLV